jgi:competence protein ComFC
LHRSRLRERGYNQAELLARRLALLARLPVDTRSLARRRQVGTQVEARSPAARRTNVEGAFVASSDASGKNVLLIDDVMTTGSTLDSAAKALKAAGVARVDCLTFAGEV